MANPADHLRAYAWQPGGPSPNPGGRSRAQQRVRHLILDVLGEGSDSSEQDGRELVQIIVRVARGLDGDLNDAKSRRWALDWLTAHVYGKPTQHVEVSAETITPEDRALLDALKLSPNARRERLAELKKLAAPASSEPAADDDAD